MRQVFQDLKTGETRLAEVPRPSVGPGQVLNATDRRADAVARETCPPALRRSPKYKPRPDLAERHKNFALAVLFDQAHFNQSLNRGGPVC